MIVYLRRCGAPNQDGILGAGNGTEKADIEKNGEDCSTHHV